MTMEREIKFRGKRIDNGEWVYGYVIYNQWHNTYKIDTGLYGIPSATVDPEIIGQYTGLKDRDGKEIYEGDIVRVPAIGYRIESGEYDTYSIRFTEGSFYIYPFNSSINHLLADVSDECEIIGNIHERVE